MDDDEITTVKVKGETWKDLNQMKEPGDSFDDVIRRVLESRRDGGTEGDPSHAHGDG